MTNLSRSALTYRGALPGAVVALVLIASAQADVHLPAIISDHMVLQKSAKTSIWGKADPGEAVTVSLDGQTVQAKADASGKWQVFLDLAVSKPGPFTMMAKGRNEVAVKDVMVGEVWLASGQSNMGARLIEATGADQEIAQSANLQLRMFTAEIKPAFTPQEDLPGAWEVSAPDTSGHFSSVAYFFGQALQHKLVVPVGMINSSVGGTYAESWMSQETIDADANLKSTQQILKSNFLNYPSALQRYATDYAAWATQNRRECLATRKPEEFAAPAISMSDWKAITLPGEFSDLGLPDSGATWIRKEIIVPAENAGRPLRVDMGSIREVAEVYWNGIKFAETTPATPYGAEGRFSYSVPGKLVQEGCNILAVRILSPRGGAALSSTPSGVDFRVVAGRFTKFLAGNWLAKEEMTLPPLSNEVLRTAPVLPSAPPQEKNVSGVLFNGMIYPLLPYSIRGVIWYQGESNSAHAIQYRTIFPALIEDWRTHKQQADLPFYFVQIAPFGPKGAQPAETAYGELREAQSMTQSLSNTGMASIIDAGEEKDVHPRDKKKPGERLAAIALAKTYAIKVPFSGPSFKSMQKEGDAIRIYFTKTDGGLMVKPLPEQIAPRSIEPNITVPLVSNSPQSEIEGFAICGIDRKWVWANAKISGDTVVVSSAQVPSPIAVRYAWGDNPTCNLYSKSGLPAPPFRTDDFPGITKKRTN